jgi:pyruvate dehydrogenase E2 component (dihydrolipoamide acetyltransferase)
VEAATASARDVVVPDIGDFSDVPIIEILVSPGDVVAAEDPLVTLESDKATMDVPAPFEGVVRELRVSVGDKVSEGSLLMTIGPDEGDQAASTETLVTPAADEAASAPSGADGRPAPEATPESDVAPSGGAGGTGASGNGASAPAPPPVEESPPRQRARTGPASA